MGGDCEGGVPNGLKLVSNIVGTRMHVWNNSRENDQN